MANGQTTTARKPSKAQINAFMCKLFEPLPDADIEDKEIVSLIDARAPKLGPRGPYKVTKE